MAYPRVKQPIYKIRLKKGDLVVVRAGKYKGQTGKITATHPRENKVTVAGINIVKKHVKPTQQHPQGAIVELTKPIWVSKVSIVEPTSKKPSRIGYKLNDDGTKTRIFRRSSNGYRNQTSRKS
jgi:large subunit ribosomal protein L24